MTVKLWGDGFWRFFLGCYVVFSFLKYKKKDSDHGLVR